MEGIGVRLGRWATECIYIYGNTEDIVISCYF